MPNVEQTKVGANLIRLAQYKTTPAFVMRRFESVEILDQRTARRTAELHLTLAPFIDRSAWPLVDGYLLLPLARLRRVRGKWPDHSHTTFDIFDEHGSQVPRFTKDEEREMVFNGVWSVACRILAREPDVRTSGRIWSIVHGEKEVDEIKAIRGADSALAAHRQFHLLLSEVHDRFYLIAPVLPTGQTRRVLTYAFEEPPQLQQPQRSTLARVVYPRPTVNASFPVPGASDCVSFHFEVSAPPDLKIPHRSARLKVVPLVGDPPPPIVDDDVSDRRAHVYYSGGKPVLKDAEVRCRLLPATTGLTYALRFASIVAFLLTGVATASVWLMDQDSLNALDRSAVVTCLLLVPAIVTTTLTLGSSHPLAAQMAWGTRLNAIIPVFGLYVGTLVSVAKPLNVGAAKVSWTVALLIATVCAFRTVQEYRWLKNPDNPL